MTSLIAALVLATGEPWLWATTRVTSGFPDTVGGSLTVHAIPYVDVEGGAAAVNPSWFVRAGPRYALIDAREGLMVRVAALFGCKTATVLGELTRGFHFAGTLDFTWWLATHFGLSLQLSGGGTFDPSKPGRKMLPDLRVGLGVSF